MFVAQSGECLLHSLGNASVDHVEDLRGGYLGAEVWGAGDTGWWWVWGHRVVVEDRGWGTRGGVGGHRVVVEDRGWGTRVGVGGHRVVVEGRGLASGLGDTGRWWWKTDGVC